MSTFSDFFKKTTGTPNRSVPVILRARARLARNLSEDFFPERLNPKERNAVKNKILATLKKSKILAGTFVFDMETIEPAEKEILVERHLISKDLAERAGAAVVISPDAKISVMINEEDHFRIQIMDSETDLKKIHRHAQQLGDELSTLFPFAFSEQHGFLTACPTNLGTGLRISAMVHLPALVMDGQMEKVVRALNICGLTVRGWHGEGSESIGSIFQISNRHTLGVSEEKIVANLQNWLEGIVEQEKNARRRVLQRDKFAFFDQVSRIYGELRYSVLLSEAEAMSMLSVVRMACDLGIFPEFTRQRIDDLLLESQAAHVAFYAGTPQTTETLPRARANSFRDAFSIIPPPTFSAVA